MDEIELGKRMVQEDLLTPVQLQTVQEYQRALGGRLTEIVGKLGFISEERLSHFVARCEHMNTVDLAGRRIDEELMRRIPRAIIERHGVLPFRQSDDVILLAMSEPMDFRAIEEIQFITNCQVEAALAPRTQVLERIARFYADHPELNLADDQLTPQELERRLLATIADPAVQALARALLSAGVLDAKAWAKTWQAERD